MATGSVGWGGGSDSCTSSWQRRLVRPGTEDLLVDERAWLESNRARLQAAFEEIGLASEQTSGGAVERLSAMLEDFVPESEHDSFSVAQLMPPLADALLQEARAGGLELSRPLLIAGSPDIGPGAAAVPSADTHRVFVGRGTMTFCNYWAKAFLSILAELDPELPPERWSNAAEMVLLLDEDVGARAVLIALYYSQRSTTVGLGRMSCPDELLPARALLITAMEAFVLAHELAHCLYEEQRTDEHAPSSLSSIEEEAACDVIGMALLTAYGANGVNPYAFDCSAVLMFWWAVKICEDSRGLVVAQRGNASSHPNLDDRIAAVHGLLAEADAHDGLREAIRALDGLLSAVHAYVLDAVRRIVSESPRAEAEASNKRTERTP